MNEKRRVVGGANLYEGASMRRKPQQWTIAERVSQKKIWKEWPWAGDLGKKKKKFQKKNRNKKKELENLTGAAGKKLLID